MTSIAGARTSPVTVDLTRQMLSTVDAMAFGPTGDTDMWSKQAKRLATLGAEYAAKSAVLLNEGRADRSDIQQANGDRIAAEQAAYKRLAQDIAFNGYGDTGYWSKRAKSLAFESAATAASTACACDGPMLAAIRGPLLSAITGATTLGFDGYGDTGYWSAGTKSIAQTVAPQIQAPHANTSGTATGPDPALLDTARSFIQNARSRAFDGYGDTEYWSKATKHLALDASSFAARVAMLDAAGIEKSPQEQDDALKRIESHAAAYASAAQEAANGYGDTTYWSRRVKALSLTTAAHVASIASECDRTMIEAMRGSLERILARTEDTAFNGYGDVSYWKERCIRLGADAALDLQMLAVYVRADSAARAAAATVPVGGHDTTALEVQVRRNRAVALELDKLGAPQRVELQRLDGRIGAAASDLQPLLDARAQIVKRQALQVKLAGAGGVMSIAGALTAGTSLWIGGPLVLAGVGCMVGALMHHVRTNEKMVESNARIEALNRSKQTLENERAQVSGQLSRLDSRAVDATKVANSAQKKLDVLRMANSTPAAPDAVRVDDASVRIGGISVPRNRD